MPVVRCAIQLRFDDVHLIIAVVVIIVAGNNAIHRDDGDFILRIVVLQNTFFQLRPDFARAGSFEIVIEAERVRHELTDDYQTRKPQQHD